MNELLALCPLDGRYANIGIELSPYFSEYSFVKKRVEIEILWLKFLIDNKIVSEFNYDNKISTIYENFLDADFLEIKKIEKDIKHDVKAIELFIIQKLKMLKLDTLCSFVHIGCTSEDIDNVAYAKLIHESIHDVWIKNAKNLVYNLKQLSYRYKNIPMLGNTHGQIASPTTVGKEFFVYVIRLQKVLEKIENIKISAKFNGTVGNYSAMDFCFKNFDWVVLNKKFIESLNLNFNLVTTQIEGNDSIIELLDNVKHFNNILLDLDIDMWLYISKDYFVQDNNKNEVSSSVMPYKINPINFENSEGNIDMSNAILNTLSNKLVRSRLQRDLSNKTLMRNIGMSFGYSLQAINETSKGLSKVKINEDKLKEDLNEHWEVLAEPIQTMLRKYGVSSAYLLLKEVTRGNNITKNDIHNLINRLDMISVEDKKILLDLTPSNYIGLASILVDESIDFLRKEV